MGWQPYKLVYQAKSPIHIGYSTLGFIQRTRYYIPGRALWGAITANLARAHFLSRPGEISRAYQDVGEAVKQHIKLSYFYPTLDPEKPLLPQFTSEGLKFGGYLQHDFESLFISAYGQTAVEPQNNTAEEGSLHETEFISSTVETKGEQKPVFFLGYIIPNDGESILSNSSNWKIEWNSLREAIKEIFVGGERKYGFGRLILHEDRRLEKDKEDKYLIFEEYKLAPNGDQIRLEIEENGALPAHLEIKGCPNLKGDIEPLVGREWGEVGSGKEQKAGAGQKISPVSLSWVPGSLMLERKTLTLGRYGILVAGGK